MQSLTDVMELEPGQSAKPSSGHFRTTAHQAMQREAYKRSLKTKSRTRTCLPWAGDGTGNYMLRELSFESIPKPTCPK